MEQFKSKYKLSVCGTSKGKTSTILILLFNTMKGTAKYHLDWMCGCGHRTKGKILELYQARDHLYCVGGTIAMFCVKCRGLHQGLVEKFERVYSDSNLWGRRTKRRIAQYDKNMKLIRYWDSVNEASKELWLHVWSISNVCRGKNKQTWGFIFKFI